MLATNISLYRRVLKLDIAKEEDSTVVDWTKFFDRNSSYKLLYTLQIVQAVLEDGETDTKRVIVLNTATFPTRAVIEAQKTRKAGDKEATRGDDENLEEPLPPLMVKRKSQIAESAAEDGLLRAQWTEEFLRQGGFQHILKDFMACTMPAPDTPSSGSFAESFELKYVAFMLRLLRTFIMAAFSTSDSDAYQVAALAKRSSGVKESDHGEP